LDAIRASLFLGLATGVIYWIIQGWFQ